MIDSRKNVVTIQNVTFGTGEEWMTKFADVMAVRDYKICEMLFHGTLNACEEFIKINGFIQTQTPTCPTMPISRVLPGARGRKTKFKK